MANMRAVELTAERALRAVLRPCPEPGPGDVLIRMEAVGICGSDLRTMRAGSLPPGTVLGHEFVGRVVDAGAGVEGHRAGDRVVVVPVGWCGSCAWCRRGVNQLCTDMWAGSIGLGARPGAFAEFVAVGAGSCRRFPEDLPEGSGTLVEPFAVGLHAVRRSRSAATAGVRVGVLGAGTIGLMVVAALRSAGAEPYVVVVESNPVRADIARRLGASHAVIDAASLGEAPLDVVFDCSGVPDTPAQIADRLAPGGELVLVGVLDAGQPYPVPGRLWVWHELDLRGSSGYSAADFDDAVAAVAGRRVDFTPVIGATFPLSRVADAVQLLARSDAPPKVLLTP